MTADVYFGAPDRVAMSQRSQALWQLLSDDPRFAYYGRLVSFSNPGVDPVPWIAALARTQGGAVAYFVPKEDMARHGARLADMGLQIDRHEQFIGRANAYDAARSFLGVTKLPPDVTPFVLDAKSPAALVQDVAALQMANEVLPVPGSIMRGLSIPGMTMAARDSNGEVVAAAASFRAHHARNPNQDVHFWGMIVTRPDRRGERIAAVLGAMVLVQMWEKLGARAFMTGVRADNRSSQALCGKLGVLDSPWAYLVASDPGQVSGRITK